MNKTISKLAAATATFLLAACGGGGSGSSQENPAGSEPASPVQASAKGAVIPAAAPPREYMQCRSCHSPQAGKHGVGPSLHAILGRPAGSIEGFNYTSALKQSAIVWNRETLDSWLEAPRKMVPGTRMVMAVRDAGRRAAILDYLESLTPDKPAQE